MSCYMIGDWIRTMRRYRGMTQKQLCDGICSIGTLSRIERGQQTPHGHTAEMLLSRLGLSAGRMLFLKSTDEMQIDRLRAAAGLCLCRMRPERLPQLMHRIRCLPVRYEQEKENLLTFCRWILELSMHYQQNRFGPSERADRKYRKLPSERFLKKRLDYYGRIPDTGENFWEWNRKIKAISRQADEISDMDKEAGYPAGSAEYGSDGYWYRNIVSIWHTAVFRDPKLAWSRWKELRNACCLHADGRRIRQIETVLAGEGAQISFLMRAYDRSLFCSQKGIRRCVEADRLSLLPLLYIQKADALYMMRRRKESRQAECDAYRLAGIITDRNSV